MHESVQSNRAHPLKTKQIEMPYYTDTQICTKSGAEHAPGIEEKKKEESNSNHKQYPKPNQEQYSLLRGLHQQKIAEQWEASCRRGPWRWCHSHTHKESIFRLTPHTPKGPPFLAYPTIINDILSSLHTGKIPNCSIGGKRWQPLTV